MPIESGSIQVLNQQVDGDMATRLMSAIAFSAEDITNGRGWPDAVHGLLESLGRITGVSRVWIFQTIELTDDFIVQDYVFEWASKPEYVQLGMQAFSMFRNRFDDPEYRALVESRKRGEWQKVITRKVKAGGLHDSQVQQAILSMLTIPIMVEDEWWGVLGFDDCEREYDWTEAEIALLRTATFLLSNAVMRDRLGAVRKQFDILQGTTRSSAWEYNPQEGRFWCTPELVANVPGATRNLRFSLRGALKLVHHDDRRELVAAVQAFFKSGEGTFRRDVRIYSQCGEVVWVEIIGNIVRDAEGRSKQFAGIAVDILKRKEREQQLLHQATTDPLTGAVNRSILERQLDECLSKSGAQGSPVSVLVLDIDNFKTINDTWGHDAGDKLLREFVTVCAGSLRNSDTIARVGGDEFVILLPEATEVMAEGVGERIRAAVAEHDFESEGESIQATASIGCTTYEGVVPATVESIIKSADFALYTAKHQGRNRLVAADPDQGFCSLDR